MSIEPNCDYCGVSIKPVCTSEKEAERCSFKIENDVDQIFDNTPEQDFGFTFDYNGIETLVDSRASELYDTMIDFLNKLSANPESDTIKWPNRVLKIEQFKTKLKNILEGTIE